MWMLEMDVEYFLSFFAGCKSCALCTAMLLFFAVVVGVGLVSIKIFFLLAQLYRPFNWGKLLHPGASVSVPLSLYGCLYSLELRYVRKKKTQRTLMFIMST